MNYPPINTQAHREPSKAEYQAMAALIIAQPELNGVVRYSALRAALEAYEQQRERERQ
jgi:hypothetical protein